MDSNRKIKSFVGKYEYSTAHKYVLQAPAAIIILLFSTRNQIIVYSIIVKNILHYMHLNDRIG